MKHQHYELAVRTCWDGRPGCTGSPNYNPWVLMGPISGLSGVAAELMRHLGYEPAEHLDVAIELEAAIGDEMLDTGRDILTAHGLTPRDPHGGEPLELPELPQQRTEPNPVEVK